MTRKDIVLRNEKPSDRSTVEEITRDAFWNQFVPGCVEHYLLHIMRGTDSFIEPLNLVAEQSGKIVGNIVYTKANIVTDEGERHEVISFGPFCVHPSWQGNGIGGMLIAHSIDLAARLGYKAILIYGDPDYYCKFGFIPAKTYGIGTAEDMYMPSLQAIELVPGALSSLHGGRFIEDPIYQLDENDAKKFDQNFLHKELRDDLPSQRKLTKLIGMREPRNHK